MRPCWIRPCRCTYVKLTCQTCAGLGSVGTVVVVAARRQGALCRWGWSSAYVRPAGTAVGASVAAHGLQLRVVVRCVWYSVCHVEDPMMRSCCCMGIGRCQISRRSNPDPSSAMLDTVPGEPAGGRKRAHATSLLRCSAPSLAGTVGTATSSVHQQFRLKSVHLIFYLHKYAANSSNTSS